MRRIYLFVQNFLNVVILMRSHHFAGISSPSSSESCKVNSAYFMKPTTASRLSLVNLEKLANQTVVQSSAYDADDEKFIDLSCFRNLKILSTSDPRIMKIRAFNQHLWISYRTSDEQKTINFKVKLFSLKKLDILIVSDLSIKTIDVGDYGGLANLKTFIFNGANELRDFSVKCPFDANRLLNELKFDSVRFETTSQFNFQHCQFPSLNQLEITMSSRLKVISANTFLEIWRHFS